MKDTIDETTTRTKATSTKTTATTADTATTTTTTPPDNQTTGAIIDETKETKTKGQGTCSEGKGAPRLREKTQDGSERTQWTRQGAIAAAKLSAKSPNTGRPRKETLQVVIDELGRSLAILAKKHRRVIEAYEEPGNDQKRPPKKAYAEAQAFVARYGPNLIPRQTQVDARITTPESERRAHNVLMLLHASNPTLARQLALEMVPELPAPSEGTEGE